MTRHLVRSVPRFGVRCAGKSRRVLREASETERSWTDVTVLQYTAAAVRTCSQPKRQHGVGATVGSLPDQPSRIRHVVLAWLCAALVIAYIDRGCLSVAEKQIRLDLQLSAEQMGIVMSAFFAAYALFQLPTAWLDRWLGTRRTLSLLAIAWSLATALCGVPGGLFLLIAARFLMGATEAGVFPSSVSALGRWFPATQRARASGVLACCMGVGGAIGTSLSGFLLEQVTWSRMFFLYAVPGIAWGIGFYWWFRDSPSEHPAVNAAERALIEGGMLQQAASGHGTPWKNLLTSPAVIWLSVQHFWRSAGAVFYLSWFPTFLRETREVSLLEAGTMASMPHWAVLLGSLYGGALSDRLLGWSGSRRVGRQGVAAASMLGTVLCVGLAYVAPTAWLAVLALSAGAFSSALAGPCGIALTMDLGGRDAGAIYAIMNTAGSLGAILFPVVVPRVVEVSGSWNAVLILLAGIHLAAGVSWLLFNSDKPLAGSHPVVE